jgi:hypothetical protein
MTADGKRRLNIVLTDRDARVVDGIAAQNNREYEDEIVEALRIGLYLRGVIKSGNTLLVRNKGSDTVTELIFEPLG